MSITALGDLPGGSFHSFGTAVSSDGKVVVGHSAGSGGSQGFRWTIGAGMVSLGYLPLGSAISSVCTGVSSDGSIVVGYGTFTLGPAGPFIRAFRWTEPDGLLVLPCLPGGSTTNSLAEGVSADGSVVVGQSSSANGLQAFRWSQETGIVGLGSFPSSYPSNSEACAVSGDGSVVVGQSTSGTGYEPFRWDQTGGMEGLGYLVRARQNSAYGVSADGAVVVGQRTTSGGWEAFRWTRATGVVGLGGNQANGVSADGRVIVGRGGSTNPVGTEAYVWTLPYGLRTLREILTQSGGDMSHWRYLTEAKAVSSNGCYVTGYGVNTNGDTEAFLADIGPTVFVSISARTNQGLNLTWSGVTNNVWLEYTASLFPPEWANIAGPIAGTNYLVGSPTNRAKGFYRVRAQ